MRGPFRYPGGKARIAGRLVRAYPPHRTYVEPMAGGAQNFWRKRRAPLEVLGDANPVIPRMLRAIQRGELARCRAKATTRSNFQRACGLDMGASKDVCGFTDCADMSFGGNRKNYVGEAHTGEMQGQLRRANARQYQERLRGVKIRSGDFARTVAEFDGPDTFVFLDPPWTRSSAHSKRFYQGFDDSALTPADVKQATDRMRAKVMVIYDNSPEVRRTFCTGPRRYHCQTVSQKHALAAHTHGGRARSFQALVATKGFKTKIPPR